MPKPYDTWTVTAHGPIEKVSERHWRVEARFPGAPFPRSMQLIRLGGDRLVIHNAIALGEAEMKEIEAWATPAFLVVPGSGHRLDARIFKKRYPDLKVVALRGSRQKVEEVVKVDTTEGDFGDSGVSYEAFAGLGDAEGGLTVKSDAGTTLVVSDVLMNMRSLPGIAGFMMGVAGFTSSAPKVTFPARIAVVKDRKALRAELEKRAETPGLARVEVGHGAPITDNPAAAIRRAASEL
jgi:hypothetical protein